MKRINIFCLIIISFPFFSFTGCSSGRHAVDRTEMEVSDFIDPFKYGDEFTPQKNSRNKASEIQSNERVETDNITDNLQNNGMNNNSTRRSAPGTRDEEISSSIYRYRVQLGIFENQASAEKLARSARSKVDLKVGIDYDTPFYRVRVGDFTTKAEAEIYVKILKDKGFKESRWIITKNNTP
ncbi:MAG: SPOR domain-containing protein [Candidatus Latescibacteria bacterium]|jgi:cell division protein FtsN|nr:SPOR domain-containing protein [Candidatus Latescibacterota bacterium]